MVLELQCIKYIFNKKAAQILQIAQAIVQLVITIIQLPHHQHLFVLMAQLVQRFLRLILFLKLTQEFAI